MAHMTMVTMTISFHSPVVCCNFVAFVLDTECVAIAADLLTFSVFRNHRFYRTLADVLKFSELGLPIANQIHRPLLNVFDTYSYCCTVDTQLRCSVFLMMDTFFVVFYRRTFLCFIRFFIFDFSVGFAFFSGEILFERWEWACLSKRFNLNGKWIMSFSEFFLAFSYCVLRRLIEKSM